MTNQYTPGFKITLITLCCNAKGLLQRCSSVVITRGVCYIIVGFTTKSMNHSQTSGGKLALFVTFGRSTNGTTEQLNVESDTMYLEIFWKHQDILGLRQIRNLVFLFSLSQEPLKLIPCDGNQSTWWIADGFWWYA